MTDYLGSRGSVALFSSGEKAVLVNTDLSMVVESGALSSYTSEEWSTSDDIDTDTIQLADAALNSLSNIALTADAGRMYTIPDGVVVEARKALKWHKEHHRGGTPVGMNTARILAEGGQIGLKKVRHIARYFPRHEVDKKGKGWTPGEDNFPSNGRIAWALWGGDAAWRWAKSIVDREDKKPVTADAYLIIPQGEPEAIHEGYDSDINSFKVAYELDPEHGPEFLIRIRLDGSGVDRLYKIDMDGQVYVWDDCAWDDLGHVDGDIYTYDKALDDPYDNVEKDHYIVDPASAAVVSALFQERPYSNVSIDEIDPEEAALVVNAFAEEDWNLVDSVTAAGSTAPKTTQAGDGEYTPEERSNIAKGALRDANGRFASTGSRVVVGKDGNNGRGEITGVDKATGNVQVKLDNGTQIAVPAKQTQAEDSFEETSQTPAQDFTKPLDTSGILGEPRTPINSPIAHLPGTLPQLPKEQLHEMLNNWPSWVASERNKYKPRSKSTYSIESVVAAAPEKQLTPKTSDVPPKYLAIVSPDDNQAVMDLVAIVPKTITTTEPITYVRKDGKWVEDSQVLLDLKSATPPPVVKLDDTILNNILQQVDGIKNVTASILTTDYILNFLYGNPITAAGGVDRNRGRAEQLRRYWTVGKGAAKIRWGQPGDWKRCVRHLSKYLGIRAKGYCQLRHKDALGMYTSTHAKLDKSHRNLGAEEFLMEEVWGENIGEPTHITDKDMLMPIEDIHSEEDDLYEGSWTPDLEIVDALEELAKCGDDEFQALIAAGGLDRNRGNAEELRQYWTRGKGAAKIRWGTPGDWKRCVRHLSKYMGVRAKGYCQLRHKDATGVYTGSRMNPGRRNNRAFGMFESEQAFDEAMISKAVLTATADVARSRFAITAGAIPMGYGSAFTIPLLLPENVESGDGRKFNNESIEIRELPLPLLWQIKTGDGHEGSVVVGRIDYVERIDGGIGNARGVFDTGPYGREAERLVRHGFIRGVSADLDQFEATEENHKDDTASELDKKETEMGKQKLIINHARVMAATIVAKPAFQECVINIDENNAGDQEDTLIPEDGVYEEESFDSFATAEALTASGSGFLESAIPMTPPDEWFNNPNLGKATPLTVDPSGRIYGHIAAWHVNHIGMPSATKPPRSRSKYAYFHTGVCRTDAGRDVPVGQLTLAGGHASLRADAAQAAKHYDDTASAIADVHAGEDEYGIWVAGSLRPDANEAQIRALRASAPSGDWRPIGGSLELVAVCQVNVPGFPIARALVASGKIMALVAAGAQDMAILRSQAFTTLAIRAQNLSELASNAPDLRSRIKDAKKAARTYAITAAAAKAEELRERALVASAVAELASISEEERKDLAEKGHALPDGSYPIRNESDLKNAIKAYGRSTPKDRAKVRTHIRKRARALGKADLIPENWKAAGSMDAEAMIASMRSRISSLTAAGPDDQISEEDLKKLEEAKIEADKQTEEEIKLAEDIKAGKTTAKDAYDEEGRTKYISGVTQPRDAKGKYRKVLARLKQDLGVAGLQDALNKVQAAEDMEFAGNYVDSAKASSELLGMIDRLDSKALNPKALENVQNTARELGRVIANLPLPFGQEAQKLRFSDLPSGLKDLIDQMISRVEDKIGKEDADVATANLKSYMSGADVYSQGEVQSEMSKLLRLLT
jgi:hypothetical protein